MRGWRVKDAPDGGTSDYWDASLNRPKVTRGQHSAPGGGAAHIDTE